MMLGRMLLNQTVRISLHPILARWDQDIDRGTQFNVPEFGLLALQRLKEFRGCKSYASCCSDIVFPPSVLGTSGGGSGVNGSSRWDGGGGRGCLLRAPNHRKKIDEWEQWARKEEEWTMRCEVEEEGRKIKGEGGAGWQWGASCLASSEELAHGEGWRRLQSWRWRQRQQQGRWHG